jgi:hypothetical protein
MRYWQISVYLCYYGILIKPLIISYRFKAEVLVGGMRLEIHCICNKIGSTCSIYSFTGTDPAWTECYNSFS